MANKKRKTSKVSDNSKKLVAKFDPRSPISEQYRTFRTNIQYSVVDEEIQTLMITSSVPAEGKSTTLANLAIVFAQQGKKVLVVDADLRRPTIHYTFKVNNIVGFTSVLRRQTRLLDAIEKTDEENLWVLTSGPIPPNPAELLSSKSMQLFIEEAKREFDMVLFDTPPLLAVADPQILANHCDGSILVVYSGKTEKEKAKKAVELLENAQSKFLGVVINHQKMQKDSYYYYYGSS